MPLELPPGTATPRPDLAPPSKWHQELTIVLGFLGIIAALIIGFFWLLDRLFLAFPAQWEYNLGQALAAPFVAQAEPGPVQDSLNEMLRRLELEWDDPKAFPYELVFISDRSTVNALALPGNYVVMYGGLLQQAESENELMMVLGHELGHFANRDHMRGLGRSLAIPIVFSFIFGDVGTTLGQFGAQFTNAQFSQRQEQAADDFGLQLLRAEYGHAGGATAFFARQNQSSTPADFFLSHPAPENRVRRLEEVISQQEIPIHTLTPLPQVLQDWKDNAPASTTSTTTGSDSVPNQ